MGAKEAFVVGAIVVFCVAGVLGQLEPSSAGVMSSVMIIAAIVFAAAYFPRSKN